MKRKRRRSKKKWIQEAIQHPGALHRQLRVPMGKKIPLGKLKKAAKKPGKLGRRARFALYLRSIHEKRG